jgi:hypothetical protein
MENKNPESGMTPTPGTIKGRSAKKIVLAIAVSLVGTAILVGGVLYVREIQSAFTIDGKRYSKSYVTKLVNEGEKKTYQSKSIMQKRVFGYLEERAAVTRLGYQLGKSAPKSIQSWDDLISYHRSVVFYYDVLKLGVYQGYSFVFDFSQRIQPTGPGETPISNLGNPVSIAVDKAYANQMAKANYALFTTHKITPMALLKKLKADSRLNWDGGSAVFSTNNSKVSLPLPQQIYYSGIYNYVITQSKPGISSIRTGTVPISSKPNTVPSSIEKETYFYFVDIEQASKPLANPELTISNEIAKLKVKHYAL